MELALTADDVRKVAQLARLELEDDEIERQTRHLNGLIEQFQALQGLDLTGIEPTSHSFAVTNVLRDDAVVPSLSRDDVLSNAPESRDGFFIVPRILEG